VKLKTEYLDRLFEQMSELFGRREQPGREEMKSLFSALLTSGLGHLNLVTREEFEAQAALLARTREKLDALEKTVGALEGNGV
jgi:BMFP domain-containing protein YqiC